MIQLCSEASMGRFHKSYVSGTNGPSAPNGRLQNVSAAGQTLFHSAMWWNCFHDEALALKESPFHKPLKVSVFFLYNRNRVAVASNNVFFCLVPGLICIPDYPFGKQQADFNFVSLLTKPEVILVLAQVRDECNKAATMSLFNSTLAKHVSLEEFEEIQIQTFTQVRECS